MSTSRVCPTCQAVIPRDAPPRVCPTCALRAGLGRGRPAAGRVGRSAAEMAARFPELDDFRLVGPGGMGTVYGARHRTLDRRVAVKVMHPHLQEDRAFSDRFVREARTLARLEHPHIVTVYDFGHRAGLYYLLMEFVDGVTLRQTIDAGWMEPAEALAIVPPICEALQYAHDQGVVHRDIKPENILLDRTGSPKIADFGLAKLTGPTGETRLTETAQVMGTPHYMAPEQFERPDRVDHRADIFALGVVLYEMLTGELPVGRFPPPSHKVEVDVRLDQVVLRTLEKEPRLRYQRASDLQLEVQSLSSPSWAPPGPAPRGPAKNDGRTAAASDYEYRSPQTLWGLPLVHIVSSRDPNGQRMRTAFGILAVGDIAVGAIAVGGFAFGGITFGGISGGLIGFGGIAAGLLVAMGGIALGSFSLGGIAAGVVARGRLAASWLELSPDSLSRVSLGVWVTTTVLVTAAVCAWVVSHAAARHRPRR